MSNIYCFRQRLLRTALAIFGVMCIFHGNASAGTIWDAGGGATTDINLNTNWDGDVVNALNGTTAATFGTGGTTATINVNASFTGITFNRDANFTLANGAGSLTIGSGGINAAVPNTTSQTYAISESNLTLGADQTWTVTNNGAGITTLNVSSIVSGAFDLTKAGTGILTLTGANTYTGKTTVSGGTLSVSTIGNIGAASGLGAPTTVADATIDLGAILRYTGGTASTNRPINIIGAAQIAKDNAGTLTLNGNITGSGSIFFRGGQGITVSSVISMNGNVGLTDNTTVTLSNASNSFAGNVGISYGTLIANSVADAGVNSAIGAGSGISLGQNSSLPNATFRYNGASSGSTNRAISLVRGSTTTATTWTIENATAGQLLTLSGDVTQTNPAGGTGTMTFVLTGVGNGALSGAIVGTPGLDLTKSGTGTWTLSGANTYTGATNISAGTLALSGGNNRLPTGTTVNFTGTSTLDVGATNQTVSSLTVPDTATTITITGTGGTLQVNGPNSLQLGPGGSVTSGQAITVNMSGLSNFIYDSPSAVFRVGLKAGTGNPSSISIGNVADVTLAGNNTITAATFAVGDMAASADGGDIALSLGVSNTINANNINIGATNRTDAVFDFNAAGSSATFRGTAGGSTPVNTWNIGAVAQFSSAGQLNFTVTNNFTNGTIDAIVDTMTIANANAGSATNRAGSITASFLMGAGTMTVDTLNIGRISSVSGATLGGNYAANGTFTLNHASGLLEAGTINLAEDTLTATGFARSVTGTFNLTNGTVKATNIQRATQTGTATRTVNFNWANGTLQNTDGVNLNITGVPFTLQAGTHTLNITGGQTATFDSASPIAESAAGQGITKIGTGTLILQAANTYTGPTLVQNGTLQLAGSLSSSTALTLGSGANSGTFILGSSSGAVDQTVTGLNTSGSGTANAVLGGHANISTLTVNNAGSNTFAGVLGGPGANENNLALVKSGAGTLNLTAANTYVGDTTLSAGTLALSGGNNRLPTGTTVNFTGTSTLDVGSTSQTVASLTMPANTAITATISGSGSLIVNGAQDLQLGPGGSGDVPNIHMQVNMAGLGNFTYNAPGNVFRVGLKSGTSNSVPLGQVATVTLGANNSITASSMGIGDTNANTDGGASTLRLGTANVINVNTINMGISRADATLNFNAGSSSATFRGTSGGTSAVNNWNIGTMAQFATATQTSFAADVNLANGTIDAIVNNMTIANAIITTTSRGGTITGSFSMGAGTLDVNTLNIGQIAGTTGSITGPVSSSGTFTLSNAAGTLNAGTINLAVNTIPVAVTGGFSKTVSGTLELQNGTIKATTIQLGAQTGTATSVTRQLNWTNGTIQNTDAANLAINNVPISLIAGTHTFHATGTQSISLNTGSVMSGTGGFVKTGTGSLVLNTNSTFAGNSNVNEGTLVIGTNNALPTGTTLNIGSGATVGSVDLSSASQTAAALNVLSNSAANNTITIGSGQNLTVAGPVTIGVNTGNPTATNLVVSGPGTFSVNNSGGTFQIGGATTTGNTNNASLDMSGLANFSANLGSAGLFRVGDNAGTSSSNGTSRAILAATSTITAGTINVGNTSGDSSNNLMSLQLGSTANFLNANTIAVAAGSGRASGEMIFNSSTGSVQIRSANGSGRADLFVASTTNATGTNIVGNVDFRGHQADLLLNNLLVGDRTTASTGTTSLNSTGTFSFDTGILNVTSIVAGQRSTLNGSSASLGTLNFGGPSTITVGAGGITLGTRAGTTGTANGIVNQTGGTATVAANVRVAATTNSFGAYNISGGSVTVAAGNSFIVGVAGGTSGNRAQLNVSGTGLVSTPDLIVGQFSSAFGEINQTGGTINVTNTNTMIVGDAGAGVSNHSAGVTNVGVAGVGGNLILGNQVTGNGTYNLSGTGVLNVYGNVLAGNQGTGSFVQTGGAAVVGQATDGAAIGNFNVADQAGSTGAASLSGGSLTVHGDMNVRSGGAVNLNSSGHLSFADTAATTQSTAGLKQSTLSIVGQFNFTGGTLENVATINASAAAFQDEVNSLYAGTFLQEGGLFVVGSNGVSDIANAVRAETQIIGDYRQESGTLAIDIFGAENVYADGEVGSFPVSIQTDSDVINVTGDLYLAGTLAINTNGVQPPAFGWYDVAYASTITIDPNSFNLSGLGLYQVIDNPNGPGQILQVAAPEPAALLGWGLASLVGLLYVLRRRA